MRNKNLLGLPDLTINILSGGIVFLLGCLGIKTIKAPNLALKVANTQLVTSSSATKLEKLAQQLQEQAEIIEQKEAKYQELEKTYQGYLKKQRTTKDVSRVINAIDDLPKVENIEEIQTEISETEEDLLEITE